MVKNLSTLQCRDLGCSPGLAKPPEKGIATNPVFRKVEEKGTTLYSPALSARS